MSARQARLANLIGLYRSLGGGWIEHAGDTPHSAEEVGSITPLNPAPWSFFATNKRERQTN